MLGRGEWVFKMGINCGTAPALLGIHNDMRVLICRSKSLCKEFSEKGSPEFEQWLSQHQVQFII